MADNNPAEQQQFSSWLDSLKQATGLGLSPEDKEKRNARLDCELCTEWRDHAVNTSPIVRFLLQHISLLPKTPSTPENIHTPHLPVQIQCTPCEELTAGGFAPNYGVRLCQNRIFSQKHLEDTLSHELIHAWDERRFEVDWFNLKMAACSEIRAAMLSGDCRWGRELQRMRFTITKQHEACAKQRAALSIRPQCKSDEHAQSIVNQVWESCSKDTRPFEELYK